MKVSFWKISFLFCLIENFLFFSSESWNSGFFCCIKSTTFSISINNSKWKCFEINVFNWKIKTCLAPIYICSISITICKLDKNSSRIIRVFFVNIKLASKASLSDTGSIVSIDLYWFFSWFSLLKKTKSIFYLKISFNYF
jgi:hypothetical protein